MYADPRAEVATLLAQVSGERARGRMTTTCMTPRQHAGRVRRDKALLTIETAVGRIRPGGGIALPELPAAFTASVERPDVSFRPHVYAGRRWLTRDRGMVDGPMLWVVWD